jgi:radical SAM protein with 4Fe4S-binding SPASM domain
MLCVALGDDMLTAKYYPREHYSTLFNADTGFFARVEDAGYPGPFWSEHGPELIDISITRRCERLCQTCYRDAGPHGKDMDYADYDNLIGQAAEVGVMQVALGGGNPNQHPDFVAMLEATRKKYGVVPSYATNGRGLSSAVLQASADLCGAVAVSAYPPYDELTNAIAMLVSVGVKTNVHFVLDGNTVRTAIVWLREHPAFLNRINALVFLNYKPVGRKTSETPLLRDTDVLEEFFRLVEQGRHPFKVGFDSCMVSGIVSHTSLPAPMFDACEAGRFSMFVSESMMAYPCSFMEAGTQGASLRESSLLDVWRNSDLFQSLRRSLRTKTKCNLCPHTEACMGGCPVFQDINLCKRPTRNVESTRLHSS